MIPDLAQAAATGARLDGETVIDVHGHMGPYYNFSIARNHAEGMLASMDRVGVQLLCISGNAGMGPGTRVANEVVQDAVKRYPGRFLGYLFINPHYVDETAQQLTSAESEGWRMIKIHPASHDYSAADEGYRAMWEYAAEHQLIVLIHTWHEAATCSPALLCQIAEQYPDADLILGHSGGVVAGFSEAIELANRHPNVYLDLTGSAHLHFGIIEKFAREADTDRVLWGSDLPFIGLPPQIGKVLMADIDDDIKRKFIGLNAERLLRKHRLL